MATAGHLLLDKTWFDDGRLFASWRPPARRLLHQTRCNLHRELHRSLHRSFALRRGALKGGHEVHPCEPMLREMKAREIPIVIGSDAHQPERVSDYFMPALSQLMKVGYDKISAFRGRERYEVDLMDALRSLTAPPSDGSGSSLGPISARATA